MTNDNYPAGVSDSDFIGPYLVDCAMCGEENVESRDNDGYVDVDHECSTCGAAICDDCWKKCPEDDAGDKVCEECAR